MGGGFLSIGKSKAKIYAETDIKVTFKDVAGVDVIAGDALEQAELLARGTVFFLYCPFGGERLTQLLTTLETIARRRPIRVCCVDLPLPPCDWLVHVAAPESDLAIYRSSSHALEDARTASVATARLLQR